MPQFEKVWYRDKPITDPVRSDNAIRERGSLSVDQHGIHFVGPTVTLDISDIEMIDYALHGTMTNPTVRVRYREEGDLREAYFTDGAAGGVGGLFGGTEKLARSMEILAPVHIDRPSSTRSRTRWIVILILLAIAFFFRVILRVI